MRLNVVPAALARLAASLIVLFALALPAAAADRALINMLGYSADGNEFAFEQFGVQDGSGFAFSDVFVVDLVNDKWTYGTPFEVQAEDESKSLGEVRAEAIAKAQDKLDEYKIEVPVQILALIGDGDANERGTRLNWSTPACCGAAQTQADDFSLILETRGINSSEGYCQDMSPVGRHSRQRQTKGQQQATCQSSQSRWRHVQFHRESPSPKMSRRSPAPPPSGRSGRRAGSKSPSRRG